MTDRRKVIRGVGEPLPVEEDAMALKDLLSRSGPMKAEDIFTALGWKPDAHWRLERAIKRMPGKIKRVKFGFYGRVQREKDNTGTT